MMPAYARRPAMIVSCLCAFAGAIGAQPVPADDSGTVLRVRTTRTVVSGLEPRNSARGAGLLIRRQGSRQRADMLTDIDDTSGTAWIDLSDAPERMLMHDVRSRVTVSMRFADMRSVFTRLLNARFDSLSTEADVLGEGPRILGHATRRVVYRQRLHMRASRGGVTQTTHVVSETDALVAPGVPESWGNGAVLSLTAGNASALLEQIFGVGAGTVAVRNGATLPKGLTLRSVTRTTTRIDGNGAILGPASSSVTVDTVEVVAIERRMHPPSLFAQPEGYRVQDFGEELQRLVASLDALSTSLQQLGKAGKPLPGQKASKPVKPPKP